MAHAIAAFMAGEPWLLDGAIWMADGMTGVVLRQKGDQLHHKGIPIFDRRPPARVLPTAPDIPADVSRAALGEARAIAAVALRGDYRTLYPTIATPPASLGPAAQPERPCP